jgi:hypothetical protein
MQSRKQHFLSLIDYLLLTIHVCASGIHEIGVKDSRSIVPNDATVGSKDDDPSGHLANVANGLQIYRVDTCSVVLPRLGPRIGRSNEERAEKKRREGHLESVGVVCVIRLLGVEIMHEKEVKK